MERHVRAVLETLGTVAYELLSFAGYVLWHTIVEYELEPPRN